MSDQTADEAKPKPDPAERGAYFPSRKSLAEFTAPTSDLGDAEYSDPYGGGRWKVLVIGADERYLPMANGTMFSTGNHPVETLLPMYHMEKAGFSFDIATLSGNPVKFEHWAMPSQDAEVQDFLERHEAAFRAPRKLSDIVRSALGSDSDYIAVFILGGHGALIGLPGSDDVKAVLDWAEAESCFVVSLCDGPAAFLAACEL